MVEINIALDFSDTPGGRYRKEGLFSGEEFREDALKPLYIKALEHGEKLYINMDGCYGYPSSFIDESFGGLSRELNDPNIMDNIVIKCDEQPNIIDEIKECINKKRGK